jgi:hypothetical protein
MAFAFSNILRLHGHCKFRNLLSCLKEPYRVTTFRHEKHISLGAYYQPGNFIDYENTLRKCRSCFHCRLTQAYQSLSLVVAYGRIVDSDIFTMLII